MKLFSKEETAVVSLILLIILVLSLLNFKTALRRRRDSERRESVSAIANALNNYHRTFGFFPPSEDGKILACKGENYDAVVEQLSKMEKFDTELYFSGLRGCDWGTDELKDLTEDNGEEYLRSIPQDPSWEKGISFLYLSNSSRYQVYSFLEGGIDEIGHNEAIIKRNLSCGNVICNFGKAYSDTPLEKSIEEYENELLEKLKKESN